MGNVYLSLQGNMGLSKAIDYFTSHQIPIALPMNDTQKYDLIADFNAVSGKICRKATDISCEDKFSKSVIILHHQLSQTDNEKRNNKCLCGQSDKACTYLPPYHRNCELRHTLCNCDQSEKYSPACQLCKDDRRKCPEAVICDPVCEKP